MFSETDTRLQKIFFFFLQFILTCCIQTYLADYTEIVLFARSDRLCTLDKNTFAGIYIGGRYRILTQYEQSKNHAYTM